MTFAKYPVSGGGGGGNVSGPGSSVNNNIVLWNGTDGTSIKDAGVSLSSYVDVTTNQTVGGIKTFSSAVNITASSNQLTFGATANNITLNIPNPAVDLTYNFPNNITDGGGNATIAMLEANQTFTGQQTMTGNVFMTSTGPASGLWLGAAPNRVVLDPGTRSVTAQWTFPNTGDSTFAALEGAQTFTGNKTFAGTVTLPASVTIAANTFARSGAHNLTLTTTALTNVTLPTTGTLATLGGVETFTGNKTFSGTVTMPSTISFTSLGSIVKAGNFAHTLTTTATSNSTFPAGTHTLAALGLAQTFSAAQTFSGGISGNVAFDTNTLFVDATNNRVGVGTNAPTSPLTVVRDYSFAQRNVAIEVKDVSGSTTGQGYLTQWEEVTDLSGGGYYYGTNQWQLENGKTGFASILLNGDTGTTSFRNGTGAANALITAVATGSITPTGAWTLGPSGLDPRHAVNGNFDITTNNNNNASYGFRLRKTSTGTGADVNYFISFGNTNTFDNAGRIASNGVNAANFFSTSDRRLKANIQSLTGGLSVIQSLRPVSYVWKKEQIAEVGFIAQEVHTILPQVVGKKEDDGTGEELQDGQEPWTLTDGGTKGFLPYLVKAIQELKAENDALAARIATLEGGN